MMYSLLLPPLPLSLPFPLSPFPSLFSLSLPLQAYALLLFWYQIFCAFSGARVIDSLNLIVFNLIYTSLPIILVAIADQDLLAPTLMRDKQLYEDGRCSKVYTRWKSWLSIFDGVYQSAVIFFVAYGVSEVLACLRDDHYLKVTYCLRFRDFF